MVLNKSGGRQLLIGEIKIKSRGILVTSLFVDHEKNFFNQVFLKCNFNSAVNRSLGKGIYRSKKSSVV